MGIFRIYGKNRLSCAYRSHGLTNCPPPFIARNGKKAYHYGSKPAREQAAEKVKRKGTVTEMILADKIINLRKKRAGHRRTLRKSLEFRANPFQNGRAHSPYPIWTKFFG